MYVIQAFNYDIEKASATLVSLREGPASPLPSATVNQPVQETAAAASSQMASGNKGESEFVGLVTHLQWPFNILCTTVLVKFDCI